MNPRPKTLPPRSSISPEARETQLRARLFDLRGQERSEEYRRLATELKALARVPMTKKEWFDRC